MAVGSTDLLSGMRVARLAIEGAHALVHLAAGGSRAGTPIVVLGRDAKLWCLRSVDFPQRDMTRSLHILTCILPCTF